MMRSRAADERGAVIVLFGLLMVGLLTVVTIVVDLGNLRSVRRSIQTEVDFAALAGASHLADNDVLGACQDAVKYLRINIEDLPSATSLPCGALPAACVGATPSVTIDDLGTASPYRIEITYPVPNSEIQDPTVPSGIRSTDGQPCERLGVRVDRTTEGFFTGIVGVKSMDIHADAVARKLPWGASRIPNLWLLDPTGCNALVVDGGAHLKVGVDAEEYPTDPSRWIGGLITLDSDGSTCNNSSSFTVDVGGTQTWVHVVPPTTDPRGEISLVAMAPGQTLCEEPGFNVNACEAADVISARLVPQPRRRDERATRAIIDHIYDCKPSYPNYHGIEITGCDTGRDPYITQLRDGIKAGVPLGFNVWSVAGYPCTIDDAAANYVLAGNWWVDCPSFQVKQGSVDFTGGNVVFTGGVQLSGGALSFNTDNPVDTLPSGCLDTVTSCLTTSAKTAAWVYMGGGLKATGGSPLNAHHTTIVLGTGGLDLGGNAPPTWTAPEEGPFNQLALWAEAGGSTKFGIAGGANLNLSGVFFTPEAAPFSLSGGGDFIPLAAQFVSYRAKVTGGGTLKLAPSGAEVVRIPPPAATLIR